jgi:hypothetical protein
MLEHVIVGGKRHSAGGTPLNVPDGSFVYSDTRALKIKNKDVLKGIFDMTASAGVTPAKIAKRYDLNQYKDLLMDPESDFLTKKTAQMMIDNNVRKLGQLALIQEGMKNFPDGVPNIALPLFANDISVAQPSQQGQPMMRKGGLVKHQTKGPVKTAPRKMTAAENAAMTRRVEREATKKALDLWYNSQDRSAEERKALQIFKNLGQLPTTQSLTKQNLLQYAVQNEERPYLQFTSPSLWIRDYLRRDDERKELDPDKNLHRDAIPVRFRQPDGTYLLERSVWETPGRREQLGSYDAMALRGEPYLNPQMINEARNKGYMNKPAPKDPYSGYSPEYKQSMTNFDKWNKDWDAAVKSGNVAKIEELKKSGAKLSEILSTTDVPWSLPFNWSWLDPRQYSVSPGTEQGQIADAGDVIGNKIDAYNLKVKNQQKQQEAARRDQITINQANTVLKKADEILTDYQRNGYNSKYSADDIKAARTIKNKLTDVRTVQNVGGKDEPETSYTYNPKADRKLLDQLTSTYPTFAPAQAPAATQRTVESRIASSNVIDPAVAGDARSADTTVVDIVVDPTTNTIVPSASPATPAATKPSAPAYIPVYKRSDAEIADFLRAQGIEVTPQFIQSVKDQKIERDGGTTTLAKYQGTQQSQTGNTYYNLTDQVIKDAAKQKGYNVTYPYSWYTGQPVIGTQTNLLPSGIFTTPTGPKPKIEEFKDYPGVILAGGWDKIYPGGFDQFKKDIEAAKGQPSEASKIWVEEVVNPYSVQMTGYPVIDVTQKDAFKPGVRWSQNPVFEKIQQPTTTVPAAGGQDQPPATMGSVPSPVYSSGYQAPWSNYSQVGFAGALGNLMGIERGNLPLLQKVYPFMPDATYLDPARAIAQQQGLTRQSQEAIMSSADPTTGRANVIAAQAQAAPQIANIMSQYDEANAQIANRQAMTEADIMNKAQMANLDLTKRYTDEMEVLEQQYNNALAEGRTELADKIREGMVDAMQRGALNVQNPNYSIGPDGRIYFKPGFDPTRGANLFASAGSGSIPALMRSYMTDYGLSGQDAAALIRAQLTAKSGLGSMNPMDALWNT